MRRQRPRRDDWDWYYAPTPTIGAAHATGEGDKPDIVAVLLVPDPEQRHGLREWYIRAPEKPGRPMGFQKPGSR